jgi:hypothetical protein
MPYKWFANRIGRTSIRKDYCSECRIRESDKTTSPHLATIYAGQENAEDALGAMGDEATLSDIAEAVRGYAEALREAQESYTESADNMESGFGHETYMSAEIREKADACEQCADTVESAADDIESMDDPDADEDEFEGEWDGDTDDMTLGDDYTGARDEDDNPIDAEAYGRFVEEQRRDRRERFEAFVQEKRDERREAAMSAANDALGEAP